MKRGGSRDRDAAPKTPDNGRSVNSYSVKLIAQNLGPLAAQVANDPDSLPQFPRIALQQPTPSGGKVWLGTALETGLSIRWGKPGAKGTGKYFPNSRCRRRNSVLELQVRALAKLREGYDIIPSETVLP